ncbi:MAG: DedA family protein [Nanoarchaeota archaeon]|nr:DedA family protein [Nanoarchaeota archaeon]
MLDSIITWTLDIIFSFGYLGIFALMFLEGIIVIIPSEALLLFAGYLVYIEKFNFLAVVLYSTLGSMGVAMLYYWLALKGRRIIEKHGKKLFIKKQDVIKSEKWFKKHGEITVFLLRFVPGFRSVISIPAGLAKMEIKKFITYTFLGSLIWNSVLCYVGLSLGESWTAFFELLNQYEIYIITIVGLLILFYFWKTKNKSH